MGVRAEAAAPADHRSPSERTRHALIVGTLFRCRAFSDAELRRAAEFWESPAPRAVATAYRETIVAAVVRVTDPKLVAAR
jgi:hypothetical protein